MLNQVVLVGRLTRNISVNKSENGIKVATIPLAIPRSFKNVDGNYDTDFINCVVWNSQAENLCKYQSKGNLLGVFGEIRKESFEVPAVLREVIPLLKAMGWKLTIKTYLDNLILHKN